MTSICNSLTELGGDHSGTGGDSKQPPHATSTSIGKDYPSATSQVPLKSYSTQPFLVATSGAQPRSLAKPPFPVGRPPQVLPMLTYVWSSLKDKAQHCRHVKISFFYLLNRAVEIKVHHRARETGIKGEENPPPPHAYVISLIQL